MNADFSFGRQVWKKLVALMLCMALALPAIPVSAATADGEDTLTKQEITVYAKAKKKDVSGNATIVSKPTSVYSYTFLYTGKAIKPKVTVKGFVTGKTISSKNYKVTYGNFNSKKKFVEKTPKEAGLYYVKITFKGDYKKFPTIYEPFRIVPAKAKINSVTGKKNAMTVKWKNAGKNQATYYEIAYSTNKNFANDKKFDGDVYYEDDIGVVSSKKGASSATVKLEEKLKKNTTYYVRVRAVKQAKVTSKYGNYYNTYTNTFYGDWSKAQKVTVKK